MEEASTASVRSSWGLGDTTRKVLDAVIVGDRRGGRVNGGLCSSGIASPHQLQPQKESSETQTSAGGVFSSAICQAPVMLHVECVTLEPLCVRMDPGPSAPASAEGPHTQTEPLRTCSDPTSPSLRQAARLAEGQFPGQDAPLCTWALADLGSPKGQWEGRDPCKTSSSAPTGWECRSHSSQQE